MDSTFFRVLLFFSSLTRFCENSEMDEWTKLIDGYRNSRPVPEDLYSSDETESDASHFVNDDSDPFDYSAPEELWSGSMDGGRRWHQSERFGYEDEEKTPIRGASLAFVFDSTGSMGDELNQVKAGAMKILAALRDHPDVPISNYIWVPFNDPGIGPVTVTTDPKLFETRMNDVIASGGGDCPEMALGAIKEALEASLPNSYIYVFTDAAAKDVHLLSRVLSLVQRKQAQVVFIITNGCLDTENAFYWVYERIAEASSGQIYKLTTNEVKEVLKYVKVALQPHVVSLLSLNKPAPNGKSPDKVEVVVDDSLRQFTVSVSGANARINVADPKGIQVNGPPRLENVLNLTNIKVVNVNEPDPGSWSVVVKSDSNYTIRSTGLSRVNFNHGFSTVATENLYETNYRPLKGAKSFVLIQTSDSDQVFNVTTVDFIDLSGNTIETHDLVKVHANSGLYRAGAFATPGDFFYLGVSGFGRDGRPIKRITSTAISAQLPEKPIVTMKTKMTVKINEGGFITCRIESVVPVVVTWLKNKETIGAEQNCSETCEVNFRIDRYALRSEGNYTCRAQNVAGSDAKTLHLAVVGNVPSVQVDSPVMASLGQRVHLNCAVRSEIPSSVTWAQFTATNERSGILHPSSTGVKLKNNSLLIDSVKAEDEGWYVCIAKNGAGESQGRVLLVIKEPIGVTVVPTSFNFAEGDSIRLTCSATGKPQPRVEWLKNQQPIKDPSIVMEEIGENVNLVVSYLERKHAGVYTCNAGNLEEFASANAELIYEESPKVKATEKSLMVKDGAVGVLKCAATGVPQPTIKWYKDGRELVDGERFQVGNDSLTIKSVDAADFGEYSCVAVNRGGSAVDHIGLTVGSAPSFLQKPRNREIQLKHGGTISCSAFGVPLPEVKWTRADGRNVDDGRMSILSTGALKITRAKYEDRGRYVCTAENVFGSVSHEIVIEVTGAVKPTADNSTELADIEVLSGGQLTIPCGILLGNPPGQVKWFKDNVELEPGNSVQIKMSGDLIVRNATSETRGSYTCLVVNAVGNTSRSFEVSVSESPTINGTNQEGLTGRIGGEVVVTCPVRGFPEPTITWTKNSRPLPISSTVFQNENGSLIIKNLTEDNSGVYICTATNSVGFATRETSVQVQVPPTFTDDVQDLPVNVVEGHAVVLNCNATGAPDPTVEWFKDDKHFFGEESKSKILRFFAATDHTGVFKCVVANDAGHASREFNVTILVPPKILGRRDEKSIKARTGLSITLTCNVTGIPAPTILWQRNGMYLTQNTSDVLVLNEGSLTIVNVTKESAGLYTCDAENPGGITQRNYYLQVNYPPKIIDVENATNNINLTVGEEFLLACMVEGNPKPNVVWKKNGFAIDKYQTDLSVLEDNTLVFIQANTAMSGTYRCEAVNSEGSVFKEYDVSVRTPPTETTSNFHPTRLEVNEGDTLALTCPTMLTSPPPTIQWIKDGKHLDLLFQERSDEAQVKLSLDGRTLTIIEAHPADRGNYSCIATNPAGRTDANFFVDVLMTPHFEEFNHVAHRTILTGGEVVLNCSVSGNPHPKVLWRKENTSINPFNTPGVQVTLDKKHLKIVNGRVNHTGTYICLATNKVNTKEREFYVTVLEPPQILGSLKQTVQVLKGGNLSLDCKSAGVPPPTYSWTKKTDVKVLLNYTGDTWTLNNAKCEDSGLYLCQVTNRAGTRTKFFDVQILESPNIENQNVIDTINGVIGGNVTLRCKTTGSPKPETTWFHNGRVLKRGKRSLPDYENETFAESYVSLELTNVNSQDGGVYTLLAFNAAGVVEKKFKIQISVPPTLLPGHTGNSQLVTVVQPLPIVLRCPVRGEPTPLVLWLFASDSEDSNVRNSSTIKINGNELWIKETNVNHSGIYVCLAANPGGHLKYSFNLSVIGAPKTLGQTNRVVNIDINDTFELFCNVTTVPNTTFSWFHSLVPVRNATNRAITPDGKTLVVRKAQHTDSGVYKCVAVNAAGWTVIQYNVKLRETHSAIHQMPDERHLVVRYNSPFTLYCLLTGELNDRVTWYKDGRIIDRGQNNGSVIFRDSYLKFSAAQAEDAGHYKCSTGNGDARKELGFKVDVVVPGTWSEWSDWSPCSVSCGSGQQIRRRTCNANNVNLSDKLEIDRTSCSGDEIDRRNCLRECQVENPLTDKNDSNHDDNMADWSPCSTTCGKGLRKKCPLNNNADISDKDDRFTKNPNDDDCLVEICNEKECPVDGQWSNWSEWSSCSKSVGLGVTKRFRKCDSPEPQNGGRDCTGLDSEVKGCGGSKCRVPGTWLDWSEWSPCSRPCGRGTRKRLRKCRLSKCGRLCRGTNIEEEKCVEKNCTDNAFPTSADVRLRGKLNGNAINERIDVKIDSSNGQRQLSSRMGRLGPEDDWVPYTPFIMSPLSWNAAYETDNADNGLTLTDGNFLSESDIKFSTGEGLRVKHRGEGVDGNGTFLVEIEVIGEVPLVEPHATLVVEPLEQDFVQSGPKTLYSFTANNVTVDNRRFSYLWNNTVEYDGHRGTMPFLVEKLTMKNISNVYDPRNRSLNFTVSSSIGKKFSVNKCPSGFSHNVRYMHCEDIDECDADEPPCGSDKICQNSFGSYTCTCRTGYKMVDGRCLDVDECSQTYDVCSQFCHNTPGSYICSCSFGYYLNEDRRHCVEIYDASDYAMQDEEVHVHKNLTPIDWHPKIDKYQEHKMSKKVSCPPGFFLKQGECKDYNECENLLMICDVDETCINLPGSFQCISTPCPNDYVRMKKTNHCVKICTESANCQRGAMVSETLIYFPATLNVTNILPLDKIGQPECNAVKTWYRVTEPTKLFQVKQLEGRHFLQPIGKLNRKTLYRVRVEALSYGPKNELLYFTEFAIFLILN